MEVRKEKNMERADVESCEDSLMGKDVLDVLHGWLETKLITKIPTQPREYLVGIGMMCYGSPSTKTCK